MKKFAYRLFAWSLAAAVFWTIVAPESARERMTLPVGMATATQEAHQSYLAALVDAYPSDYEIELLGFQDLESDVWGWTDWDEDREVYEIHYYTEGPLAFVRETIMHEYAHVLVGDAIQDTAHDGVFWGAYGNLYRFMIGE